MENKQKPVERETRQLIQTYNVLLKSQIYAYFAKTQRDHFVGRAFKTLEKEKQIYIHQDLEMAAINEEAFKARNVGTLQAFWVLLDIMDQKEVDQHFLASKEEVERIHQKMDEIGIRSMGAYLRKMALDGYCINLELQDVKALVSLLRICSNNLNQYAKKANETGSIYEVDIKDLQDRLEEIWLEMKEVLVHLSSIR